MKLVLTEEEKILTEAARGFLDQTAPVGRLRGMRDDGRISDPDLWQEMVAAGWSGVLVPEDCGGTDMGFAAANILAGEMGKTLAVSPFISTAVMAATVFRDLETVQAKQMLEAIANGDVTYALAIDEGAKFNPEKTILTAEKRGNGYVLNGKKCFVVDGCGAQRMLVLARTDEGLSLFDVERKTQGVTVQETKMIDSRDCANVTFENVELSGEALLGTEGKAMSLLCSALSAGQAALAAESVGLARGAFEMTTGYLKERKQFGVPIGAFQALQHRAAHLWCEIELAQSAVLNAGRQLDTDPKAATLAVSVAKAKAADTAQLAVREGVQMHGGIGMTDAFDMGFYMKRARVSAEWLGDYGYHAEKVAVLRGF